MNPRPGPTEYPENCPLLQMPPYILIDRMNKMELRLENIENVVVRDGLQAAVKRIQSDEFALSIGQSLAEHAGRQVFKASAKWLVAGILLLLGASLPGLLKTWGLWL